MKQKLLFIYPEMMIGGSTTSLVALLNTIDYTRFEVDLVLYKKTGDLLNDIPGQVNLLPEACKYPENTFSARTKKALILLSKGYLTKAVYLEWKYKKKLGLNLQIMAYAQAALSVKIEKEYDAAIGFLELWADVYLTSCVKAKKKIGWIHVDYENAPYIPELDRDNFMKLDKIVCVSKVCLEHFNHAFPELKNKSLSIENILSSKYIKKKAEDEAEMPIFNGLKFMTVCMIYLQTKGLDRAVSAAARLRKDGYGFKWFLIGDGPDKEQLRKLIARNGLEDSFVLLGKKVNPYPYLKKSDAFVLTSRNEGKPISVTEAQILGVPLIVTNYSSASEQVLDGVEGLIAENSEEGIYRALKTVLDHPDKLKTFQQNLSKKEFGNEEVIERFYGLLQ